MTKVTEFANQHNVEMEFHLYTVEELKTSSGNQASNWATFEKNAGLFCIFGQDKNKLKHTAIDAKAIGTSLHKFLFKNEKAQSMINDNDVVLSIVMKTESYMSASLKNYINKMAL